MMTTVERSCSAENLDSGNQPDGGRVVEVEEEEEEPGISNGEVWNIMK